MSLSLSLSCFYYYTILTSIIGWSCYLFLIYACYSLWSSLSKQHPDTWMGRMEMMGIMGSLLVLHTRPFRNVPMLLWQEVIYYLSLLSPPLLIPSCFTTSPPHRHFIHFYIHLYLIYRHVLHKSWSLPWKRQCGQLWNCWYEEERERRGEEEGWMNGMKKGEVEEEEREWETNMYFRQSNHIYQLRRRISGDLSSWRPLQQNLQWVVCSLWQYLFTLLTPHFTPPHLLLILLPVFVFF